MDTVKIKEKYIAPLDLCHQILGALHMACIYHVSKICLDPLANWQLANFSYAGSNGTS